VIASEASNGDPPAASERVAFSEGSRGLVPIGRQKTGALRLRVKAAISCFALCLTALSGPVRAQSPVMSLALGPDQIGVIKSAQEITTRISFTQPVKEVICGDLYDGGTGKGSFIVQRSGKDIFLKPIVTKGLSNMFVKTGDKVARIYNFDLEIVPPHSAYRIVNVIDAPTERSAGEHPSSEHPATESGGGNSGGAGAGQRSDEIIRNARQQAQRIIAQAEQRAADVYRQATEHAAEEDRQAAGRADQEVQRRFVQALMPGIGESRTINARAAANKVVISLDRRVLKFGDKSYLRYTILNNSASDFAYTAVALQASQGSETKSIAAEVTQNKNEFRVTRGESLVGIVAFDSKLVGSKDVLTLTVRGDNDSEIAHLVLIQ
jgi:vacuolar-type H+-ATPase subunit H